MKNANENTKRTLTSEEVYSFLALPENEREARTKHTYRVDTKQDTKQKQDVQSEVACIYKEVNKANEEVFEDILREEIEKATATSDVVFGYTAQYKKHKYCIRIYENETRTKFFNLTELFYQSRSKSIKICARERDYIPNIAKNNFYAFHEFWDMKHESFLTLEQMQDGIAQLLENYILIVAEAKKHGIA